MQATAVLDTAPDAVLIERARTSDPEAIETLWRRHRPAAVRFAYGLVGPRMRASVSALVLLTISLIGHGLGPVFMGFASDRFAARDFTANGDFATACANPATLAGDLAAACAQASAQGVRYGAIACACFFLWGAWHYYRAARTLARDTYSPDSSTGTTQEARQ